MVGQQQEQQFGVMPMSTYGQNYKATSTMSQYMQEVAEDYYQLAGQAAESMGKQSELFMETSIASAEKMAHAERIEAYGKGVQGGIQAGASLYSFATGPSSELQGKLENNEALQKELKSVDGSLELGAPKLEQLDTLDGEQQKIADALKQGDYNGYKGLDEKGKGDFNKNLGDTSRKEINDRLASDKKDLDKQVSADESRAMRSSTNARMVSKSLSSLAGSGTQILHSYAQEAVARSQASATLQQQNMQQVNSNQSKYESAADQAQQAAISISGQQSQVVQAG